MNVLYKKGEMHIQSHLIPCGKVGAFCQGSRVAYTSHSVESFRQARPELKLEVVTLESACDAIQAINRETYCKPWKRTTESNFYDMLEVLFPDEWETVDGVEIFRMSEALTGNISGHYARHGDKYWQANRETGKKGYFKAIAAEIKKLGGENV